MRDVFSKPEESGFGGINQRSGGAEGMLEFRHFEARGIGWEIPLLSQSVFKGIERAAGGADCYGMEGEFGNGEGRTAIKRVLMDFVARLRSRRSPLIAGKRQDTMGGNCDRFHNYAARARALHAEHVPVVDDGELLAVNEYARGAVRCACKWVKQNGGAEEVGGDVAACAVIPLAGEAKAIGCDGGVASWRDDSRYAGIAAFGIDFALGLLREEAKNGCGLGGEQGENPAAIRAAAGDFKQQAHEIRDGEFVAAVAARLENAIEAGVEKIAVGFFGKAAGGFAGLPAGVERSAHCFGAAQHFRWSQRRFRGSDMWRRVGQRFSVTQSVGRW